MIMPWFHVPCELQKLLCLACSRTCSPEGLIHGIVQLLHQGHWLQISQIL